MATISITIPDATVPRIRAAFGKWGTDPETLGTWVPATAAEVVAAIKEYAKNRVRDYEAQQAALTVHQSVTNENW